jgi:AraC-like DNA-binding protein
MDAPRRPARRPRARGAFLLRAVFAPPWSMRIEDEAPLTLMAVLAGAAWVHPAGGDWVRLGRATRRSRSAPTRTSVADDPGTPPEVRILPGPGLRDPDGEEHPDWLGTRTWGNDAGGSTTAAGRDVRGRRRGRRPAAAHAAQAAGAAGRAAGLAAGAAARRGDRQGRAGQEAVLDRLLDLLLIAVLRAWFARPDADAPGWYAASADPVVGPALRLLHHEPSRPWTGGGAGRGDRRVPGRAGAGGSPSWSASRRWRSWPAGGSRWLPTCCATRRATLAAVARQVGYGSPYALSTAFKRVRGVSPREHRAAVAG